MHMFSFQKFILIFKNVWIGHVLILFFWSYIHCCLLYILYSNIKKCVNWSLLSIFSCCSCCYSYCRWIFCAFILRDSIVYHSASTPFELTCNLLRFAIVSNSTIPLQSLQCSFAYISALDVPTWVNSKLHGKRKQYHATSRSNILRPETYFSCVDVIFKCSYRSVGIIHTLSGSITAVISSRTKFGSFLSSSSSILTICDGFLSMYFISSP